MPLFDKFSLKLTLLCPFLFRPELTRALGCDVYMATVGLLLNSLFVKQKQVFCAVPPSLSAP